jgi:hypothetical protein
MAVNINIPKPIIDYNDLENKPTIPEVIFDNIQESTTNTVATTLKTYNLGLLNEIKGLSIFTITRRVGSGNGQVFLQLFATGESSIILTQRTINNPFYAVGKFLVAIDNISNTVRTNTSNTDTDIGSSFLNTNSFNATKEYSLLVRLQAPADAEVFCDGVKVEIYK